MTGSGKTFTMANVIEQVNRPTLVLAHNKTLAAQLYAEFKEFFPNNAVEYFVSYYDYYQPEAYVPRTDTFIEKDADINEEIDKLRHAATRALLTRRDVIIVASVSCIYGLGSPEEYSQTVVSLRRGGQARRDKIVRQLIDIQYDRNDMTLVRGTLPGPRRHAGDLPRLRGDRGPGRVLRRRGRADRRGRSADRRAAGRAARSRHLPGQALRHDRGQAPGRDPRHRAGAGRAAAGAGGQGKVLEAARLRQRTMYDLEMMQEAGYCSGIENYSMHLSRRKPGEQPSTLMDYFPDDFLIFVDESHISLPQVRGMYAGDRSRKDVLVEHGFRLPSARENRPLTFAEFERMIRR